MLVEWIELCDFIKSIGKSGGDAGSVWQNSEIETIKVLSVSGILNLRWGCILNTTLSGFGESGQQKSLTN